MSKSLEIARAAIKAKLPVLIWGASGIGKTAWIEMLAREMDALLITLIGSITDPIDIGGMPIPKGDGTLIQTSPPWALKIRKALDNKRDVIFFLDELSCAPPAVQAGLLRVVHDMVAGETSIKGCSIVAASNPPEFAADGGLLSAAMASRWIHVDLKPEASEWINGTLCGWGESSTERIAKAGASICEYIRRNPAELLVAPSSVEHASRAWPCPRSWTKAIVMLAQLPLGSRDSLARDAVAACVGDGAASQWWTWEKAMDLPDPEEILAGRAKIPDRGDLAHASVLAMAALALSEHPLRTERIKQAWTVLGKVRPDISLNAARILTNGAEEIAACTQEAVSLGSRIIKVKSHD